MEQLLLGHQGTISLSVTAELSAQLNDHLCIIVFAILLILIYVQYKNVRTLRTLHMGGRYLSVERVGPVTKRLLV
jgi:hypothetical protein